MCLEYIEAIDTHLSDGTGWFMFSNDEQGRKTMPLFASLDAFYPGLLMRDFPIYLFVLLLSRFSLFRIERIERKFLLLRI